jgi:hypothetical protein
MNIALIIVLVIIVVGGTRLIWREGAPMDQAPRRDPELKEQPSGENPTGKV